MKLFKKSYKVLSSKAKLKLKRKLGFSITLSDIENINFKVKKYVKKRG